jgi:hypothetical protein
LTLPGSFVCIPQMRPLLLVSFALTIASCTTLENRRDLYRSPAEGYEQWYPNPPPTRLRSLPPAVSATRSMTTKATERNGVITFPEENALPESGR